MRAANWNRKRSGLALLAAGAFVFGGVSSAAAQERVNWTDLVNAEIRGNSVEKTRGCDGCGDAGQEHKVDETGHRFHRSQLGLAEELPSNSFEQPRLGRAGVAYQEQHEPGAEEWDDTGGEENWGKRITL